MGIITEKRESMISRDSINSIALFEVFEQSEKCERLSFKNSFKKFEPLNDDFHLTENNDIQISSDSDEAPFETPT